MLVAGDKSGGADDGGDSGGGGSTGGSDGERALLYIWAQEWLRPPELFFAAVLWFMARRAGLRKHS